MRLSGLLRPAVWGAVVALPLLLLGPLSSSQAAATSRTAKVVRVVDGDTVKVDYDRDGEWDDAIRLIGIDTPETGQCGAGAAKRALKSLLGRKVVQLVSDTGRIGRQNRPERRVIATVGGQKVDATTWLLQRGLGVWMPRKDELTNNLAHHRAVESAAAQGVGWFDEDRCGAGSAPERSLSMHVQYAADAAYKLTVAERRNQEFIRIRNDGLAPVDLDGWVLRVGNDRREHIPAGGPIPAGETLTVHVGSGVNTVLHRYIGSSVTMLVDADLFARKHVGGGAYLVDPGGDIRAFQTWPCAGGCADPTGGALVISEVLINPPVRESLALNSEYIALTNRGNSAVRTGDMVVEVSPWVYEFPPDHVLEPGETLRIYGGGGEDDRLVRHIDARNPVLPDDEGRVVLRTYDAVVVDCYTWGGLSCPPSS